jgi:acyl-CoA synthetase (AMP-forming)/AMP-acid ligase II
MNVAELFLAKLRSGAADPAIVSPSGRETASTALADSIAGLSGDLSRRDVMPGDRIWIQTPNGRPLAEAVVAVLAVGATAVLIDPSLPTALQLKCVKQARVDYLLVHPMLQLLRRLPFSNQMLTKIGIKAPMLPRVEGIPTIRTSWRQLNDGSKTDAFWTKRSDDNVAILVFTGGTTSDPRCVRISHGGTRSFFDQIRFVIGGSPVRSVVVDTAPQLLYALALGNTAHVARGDPCQRAKRFVRLATRGDAHMYFSSPIVWREIVRLLKDANLTLPASFAVAAIGGAPVFADLVRDVRLVTAQGTRVVTIYGSTETGPVCVCEADVKTAWQGPGNLVGRSIGGALVRIENPNSDGVGEVVVESPACMIGYQDAGERTGPGVATGDLGRMTVIDDDEYLSIVGRKKDMIIRAGVNIYPSLIESVIAEFLDESRRGADPADCAVVGLWDNEIQDERMALCFEGTAPLESGDVATKGMAQRVRTILGPAYAPDYFIQVGRIPRTGRQHKIDRKELRRLAAEKIRELERQPARTSSKC